MKPTFNRLNGYREPLGRLVGGQLEDVAKQDHLSMLRRQSGQGGSYVEAHLELGRRLPSLHAVQDVKRQSRVSRRAASTTQTFVLHDAKHPSGERCDRAKRADAAPEHAKRLLHRLFDVFVLTEASCVASDVRQGPFVAATGGFDARMIGLSHRRRFL
jgi:hypothetical protein